MRRVTLLRWLGLPEFSKMGKDGKKAWKKCVAAFSLKMGKLCTSTGHVRVW